MLSAFDDDEVVAQSILAGASGYVLKQFRRSDIVTAVRIVSRGELLFDNSLRARVLARPDGGPAEEHSP